MPSTAIIRVTHRRLALSAAALAVMGALALPTAHAATPGSGADSGSVSGAPLAREVVTAPTDSGALQADALVEAVRESTVSAQVAGAIVQLNVRVGDRVQAGQILAHLDAQAAQQTTAASAAQVQAAHSQALLAQKELERQRQLFGQRYISAAGLDRAQAQSEAAAAQLRALQAQTAAAQAQSNLYTVRAPYAAVVSEVPVAQGDMVVPGRPLVRLYDPRALRITATLAQSQLALWDEKSPATLELPGATPARSHIQAAALQRLPTVDARTHTVQLRADLPQGVQGAVPGMFARLWLPGGHGAGTPPTVPQTAVLRRAEVTALYVLDTQGQPRLRLVRLGQEQAGRVQVLSGLRVGETIALEPLAAAQVQPSLQGR